MLAIAGPIPHEIIKNNRSFEALNANNFEHSEKNANPPKKT